MKNIILYASWLEEISECFSQEETGELLRLIIQYQTTEGWEADMDLMKPYGFFLAIRKQLDKQFEYGSKDFETILHKDLLDDFNLKQGFMSDYDDEKDEIIIKKIK